MENSIFYSPLISWSACVLRETMEQDNEALEDLNLIRSISHSGGHPHDVDRLRRTGRLTARERIKKLLDNSLMLVTALSPKIGYDNAAKIAKQAHKNGTTLKEESIKSGLINEKEYNKIVNPQKMIKPY